MGKDNLSNFTDRLSESIAEDLKKILTDALGEESRDSELAFRATLKHFMNELECFIGPPLADVEVTACSDTQYSINIMRAFKDFPQTLQELICCKIVNFPLEEVRKFVYSPENYIVGIIPKRSMDAINFTLKLGETNE